MNIQEEKFIYKTLWQDCNFILFLASTMFAFESDCTLVSYITHQNINVNLISIIHRDDSVSHKSGKPKMIHIIKQKEEWVPLISFVHNTTVPIMQDDGQWSLMNVTAINANIIFVSNNSNNKPNCRELLEQLSLDLLVDFQKRRVTCNTLLKT